MNFVDDFVITCMIKKFFEYLCIGLVLTSLLFNLIIVEVVHPKTTSCILFCWFGVYDRKKLPRNSTG